MEASDEAGRDIGDPRAYLCATPMAVKRRDFSCLMVLFRLKMHSQQVLELALLYRFPRHAYGSDEMGKG